MGTSCAKKVPLATVNAFLLKSEEWNMESLLSILVTTVNPFNNLYYFQSFQCIGSNACPAF